MGKSVPYLLLAALAGAIVLLQGLAVYASDASTITPEAHKVFSYGFPFLIIDGAESLPQHMTAWQVTLRLAGNAAFFFSSGILVRRVFWRRCALQPPQPV